ncbi:adenylate kinase 8-like isoform X3 [Danaus plexippus]|uniref:adenylate kinase 8-like isoform X3 n=1 Tax=Danaus plexippus TaxID=13037 RepID=UPI002AB29138|nr:adenylate kinase 8-like isoform X3 [Danaus plexippus]
MTETDATKRPLEMPETFLPYLEKYRIYKIFKDMVQDLVVNLPRDHLKHMKVFLNRHLHCSKDVDRVILLVSPALNIDVRRLARDLIKELGFFVITRNCVMDRYEKHDDYVPGCVSPSLLSKVTKLMTTKDPVTQAGWLMFDHPCTVREARCLQQDGVLPTVTLVLMPPPPTAPVAEDPRTPARTFFTQDFEGLKFAYKATLKEVHIESEDVMEHIVTKCVNAIAASAAGAQGPGQGIHATGAPGVYRVILMGPRGSGRKTQAMAAAKHFGLVYLNFEDLFNEALVKKDDIGEKLRKHGTSVQLKAEVVRRRIAQKDCIDHGWIFTGYPSNGVDFEYLDNMPTPPNRHILTSIIILNTERSVCKARTESRGVDWCTGREAALGSGPRVLKQRVPLRALEAELETYFTENLAELRAAAGITAVEIDGNKSVDYVQVKVQAAIMAAPTFNIEYCSQLKNVRADELVICDK